MADWYCYFNHKKNVSLQIVYESKIHEDQNAMTVVQVNFEKLIWKKSLFLFGFKEQIESFCKIYKPNEKYPTEPDSFVIAWFHPRPMFYLLDFTSLEKELVDPDFENFKTEILEKAKEYGLKETSFEYAQKIAEISAPFKFNPNYASNRTIDIHYSYKEILSPINPTKRIFIFEKVYKIKTDIDNYDGKLNGVFEKIDLLNEKALKLYLSEPNSRERVSFLHIKHSANFEGFELLNSKNLVEEIFESELTYLKYLEQLIKIFFPTAEESTEHFLFQEIGLLFK